jgi:hypothetical protein
MIRIRAVFQIGAHYSNETAMRSAMMVDAAEKPLVHLDGVASKHKGTMLRPTQLIVAAVAIGICGGGILHLSKLRGEQPKTAAASGSFLGYATPENALYSIGWAGKNGDLESLREGVTPDVEKMVYAANGPNAAAHALGVAAQLAGGTISKKEVLSGDQVLLYVQPTARNDSCKVWMQKVGSTWKLANFQH